MYQIFPDRFARSKNCVPPPQNKDHILREDWGGAPLGPDADGVVRNRDFFGGNLRGIQERLPYLESLGVTVLYLNPIFEAYSNHRYDTADYTKIDPLLGTEADFRELCRKAGDRGIRILLDGVFNHTGSDSIYFNQSGRFPGLGAYQSRDSLYYPWYRFEEWPEKYACWWGIKTLPAVNEEEPSYLDYMVRGKDSVARRWLRAGASGWRLDVVDELPDLFLEEFRKAVKEEKPEAAIVGEVWEDASTKVSYGQKRHYLDGTQLDSVMNYPLKDAVLQFLNKDGDAASFGREVETLRRHYPETVFYGLMNILGTHDTPRILTLLSEGRSPREGRRRLFAALLLWAFLPGIPCIYYGDELGMEGGKDPENRRCFQEEAADPEVRDHYRRLLAFRKKRGLTGEWRFRALPVQENCYAFVRETGEKRLLVAVKGLGPRTSFPVKLEAGEELEDVLAVGEGGFEEPGELLRRQREAGLYPWALEAFSGVALAISRKG
ncbi:MAG: glycoside hydrolase family 13 protein [Bacillota bacterium]|nr:glycoside hydrolase family 13 protein [Bacillota bacterium]